MVVAAVDAAVAAARDLAYNRLAVCIAHIRLR